MPTLARIIALLACLVAGDASAQTPAHVSQTLTARVAGTNIAVYLYKPAGKGRFPLIVLSHGTPSRLQDRSRLGADTLQHEALAFVGKGAAVAVPIRRGFGGQGKPVDLHSLNCTGPSYYDTGVFSTQDIGAAMSAVLQDPQIDASRVVLVGHSTGGFASVAAATRLKVLGVVSFAGGRGSLSADKVTCEGDLDAAMQRYGHDTHVPELWIYAQNDHIFGPQVAARLRDAFVKGGGDVSFIAAPPYRTEGHDYIEDAQAWSPAVDGFLKRIGFFATGSTN